MKYNLKTFETVLRAVEQAEQKHEIRTIKDDICLRDLLLPYEIEAIKYALSEMQKVVDSSPKL